MILLHDLKGAMEIDSSKDMSVNISICITHDSNALTPIMWKLWRLENIYFFILWQKWVIGF